MTRHIKTPFWRRLLLPTLTLLSVTGAWGAPVDLDASGPWLVYDYSLGMGMGTGYKNVGGARFEVWVSDGGPFQRLWRAEYGRINRWNPNAVNLAAYAGKKVRIRLQTEQIDHRICQDMPFWGNPRVVTGQFTSAEPLREICNLAMTPPTRMGGLLADGTIVPLAEKAQDFGYQSGVTLVTPGMVNRKHAIMVYAGDKYITVSGKSQPGVYMGYDMSWEYGKYGGEFGDKPYIGAMPPPVFAEWEVELPAVPAPAKAVTPPATGAQELTAAKRFTPTELLVLSSREDKYKYQTGLIAECDAQDLAMRVNMGSASSGWAFTGQETMLGQAPLKLKIAKSGAFAAGRENGFAGLVVDYHTARGYQKRLLFGLGAGSAERSDLRPADWYLDEASFGLLQRLGWQQEFLDLQDKVGPDGLLELPVARYAPADWDGRIWLGAGVQNQPAGAGLQAKVVNLRPCQPNPPLPDLTALRELGGAFATLENGEWVLAVSRTTGAVAGLWRKKDATRLLAECTDGYRLETRTVVTPFSERGDRVRALEILRTADGPVAVVSCDNPAAPGLLMTKSYRFAAGIVSKRIEFSTTDMTGFFISWQQNSRLDDAFLAASQFGAGFAAPKRVAQGKVLAADEAAPSEQADTPNPPMQIRRDFALGLAAYRIRVNDRFVLRGVFNPERTGWNLRVFTDYVRAAAPVSAEARWVAFQGDFTALIRHYADIPEYQALWKQRTLMDWGRDLLLDTTWFSEPDINLAKSLAPMPVSATLWFLGVPWGNWGADHEVPNKNHHDVYGLTSSIHQTAPNLRLSTYHNFLFDGGSDVFRQHPEMGVRDRDGLLVSCGINSDTTRGPSYWFQMANPEVRRHLVSLHRAKMRKWKLDFLYFDGPGFGAEEIDWGQQDVAQSYDYLDYLQATYQAMREENPESLFFSNACMPLAQIGYIEFRHEQWRDLSGKEWRPLAFQMLNSKLTEPEGFTTVPLYGFTEDQGMMLPYIILYGWCGNFAGGVPWKQAATEYRGMKLVADAVEPRWWRSGNEFEAYGFTQDDRAIINVLSHEEKARDIELVVEVSKLNLPAGTRLDAKLRMMNPPIRLKPGPAATGKPEYEYNDGPVFTESVLFTAKRCSDKLKLTIPCNPLRVTSVVLTKSP